MNNISLAPLSLLLPTLASRAATKDLPAPELARDSSASSYETIDIRKPELPFGPAIADRTAILCGLQAIQAGKEAQRYLELLESGSIEQLRILLLGSIMVGESWENLATSYKTKETL